MSVHPDGDLIYSNPTPPSRNTECFPNRTSSRCGKSFRKCAPRLSSRASAEATIIVAIAWRLRASTDRRPFPAGNAIASSSAFASRNRSASRSNPAFSHINARRCAIQVSTSPASLPARTAAGTTGFEATGAPHSSTIASAARAPKTSPSNRELLARRLAPCTPVHAHSPAAYNPASEVRPCVSVRTPPIR